VVLDERKNRAVTKYSAVGFQDESSKCGTILSVAVAGIFAATFAGDVPLGAIGAAIILAVFLHVMSFVDLTCAIGASAFCCCCAHGANI
jgi:hypothetical protein